MYLLKIMAISIILTGITSKSYADSKVYVGAEYLYNSIKGNLTDDINVETLAGDIRFSHQYESSEIQSRSYNSGGIYLGYEFYPNFFIEAGYAESRHENKYFDNRNFGLLNGFSKVRLKQYRIELLSKYTFKKYNKISLIGSVGVISRKVDSYVEYETGGGCIDPTNCNPNVIKKDNDSSTRTRAHYGVGFLYDLSKNVSTRIMVKSLLNDFPYHSGAPYSVSLGAQYYF